MFNLTVNSTHVANSLNNTYVYNLSPVVLLYQKMHK